VERKMCLLGFVLFFEVSVAGPGGEEDVLPSLGSLDGGGAELARWRGSGPLTFLVPGSVERKMCFSSLGSLDGGGAELARWRGF
jgi:hypothetical protein